MSLSGQGGPGKPVPEARAWQVIKARAIPARMANVTAKAGEASLHGVMAVHTIRRENLLCKHNFTM